MKFQRYTDVDGGGFNMTPVIDIVFLLIIFFMIVCQFIVAENFSVSVPDDIASGQRSVDQDEKTTMVTVMPSVDGGVSYAVGAEVVASSTTTGAVSVVSVVDVSVTGSVVLHAEIARAMTRASKMRHVVFIFILQELFKKNCKST